MSRLKIEQPGPGYSHFPVERTTEWFEQLLSEVLVTTYSRGTPVREWKRKKGVRAEVLDARCYSYAALCGLVAMGLRLDAEAERIGASRPKDSVEPAAPIASLPDGAGAESAAEPMAGFWTNVILKVAPNCQKVSVLSIAKQSRKNFLEWRTVRFLFAYIYTVQMNARLNHRHTSALVLRLGVDGWDGWVMRLRESRSQSEAGGR